MEVTQSVSEQLGHKSLHRLLSLCIIKSSLKRQGLLIIVTRFLCCTHTHTHTESQAKSTESLIHNSM